MYNKILLTSLFLFSGVLSSTQIFAAGSCQIESGPIPELALYSRSVDAELERLVSDASKSGVCGISAGGASAGLERTLSVMDGAGTKVSYFPNLLLDFHYNISLTANGETRSAVMRDGTIFSRIDERISRSLSNIASRCQLPDEVQSGYARLLSDNQTLSNIFKQTALGTPVDISVVSLSADHTKIANAIVSGYSPTQTEGCIPKNNQSISDGIRNIVDTTLKAIQDTGKKNESVLTDWKKAILLFQGGGGKMSTEEYTNTQRRLLQQELSRQGYSSRTAQAMLNNFDCFKSKTQGDSSAEAATLARQRCLIAPVVGLENILLPWRKLVDSAKTTTDRVQYVESLSREAILKRSIISTYSKLETYRTPAIDIKLSLMTNLIDIHLGLVSTAEQVEKRLPKMHTNCMKAQPIIPCPKP